MLKITYTYYNFYKYLRLYIYIIIACKFNIINLYAYFYFIYLVKSYHKTYYTFIKPISIEDLALDLDLFLSKLCKLYEQLKIKRVKKIFRIIKKGNIETINKQAIIQNVV